MQISSISLINKVMARQYIIISIFSHLAYSFTVARSKLLILECDFISTLAKRDPMSAIQSELLKRYLYDRNL